MANLKQLYCEQCNKGLKIFAEITVGKISVDCTKCGHRNLIQIPLPQLPVDIVGDLREQKDRATSRK